MVTIMHTKQATQTAEHYQSNYADLEKIYEGIISICISITQSYMRA